MSGAGSAIYAGEVMHHRLQPRRHRFVYRMRSFLFDVDALPELSRRCRLFSLNRFNLFSFFYRDFGDGSEQSPRQYLESVLADHGIDTPLKRAEILCYPRILGFTFNPLTLYYCYDEDDRPFAVLYEVSNTFGERHSYLIPVAQQHADNLRHSCSKQLYVSPFMGMDQRYHFRVKLPGEELRVLIRLTEAGRPMLYALFQGRRRPFSDSELLRSFLGIPLMTVKAVVAIHWQALKLWGKGLPLYTRGKPPARSVSLQQIP